MTIQTTLTGSYPPLLGVSPEESMRHAVSEQIKAGIDLLVDGQIRHDIASLFAPALPGIEGKHLPYQVQTQIELPQTPISLADYQLAKQLANGRPVKAHVTGPTFLAQSCQVVGDVYKPYPDTQLVTDIAMALAREVHFLHTDGGAEYIQIDEPSFAFGADLKLGLEAIKILVAAAPQATFILHVCGDVTDIFTTLLDAPVSILNLEGAVLRKLDVSETKLQAHQKRIAYGCISVNTDLEGMESERQVKRDVSWARERLGAALWGITPNCGLRLSSPELAQMRIQRLVAALGPAEQQVSELR
jgi:5-methyltetrahydropteroyltriglutamate--homocysteine methyltransferase